MSLYRTLALSDHPMARAVRSLRRKFLSFSLPAPRIIFLPILWLLVGVRTTWYFLHRILVCEPLFKLFKMQCKSYGKNLHTGVFLHRVFGNPARKIMSLERAAVSI
jgi:hypothetical protein